MKIGVFDSGIGGLSVTNAIKKALPDVGVVYVSDREHMPYGDKPPEQVLRFVVPLLENLVAQGCDAIVIACNTVTTHHIAALRKRIEVPLIGIEPMVKPAVAVSKTGVIAVCATPATLVSKRYTWLKETYAKDVKVLEPDCSRWAYMIEHNEVNEEEVARQISEVCDQGADVIVLGCTHYHWIEKLICEIAGKRAVVVQPEEPVIAQLKAVIGRS
jgi:glutamate racemase